MILRGELRTLPKTRALDVHPNVVQGRFPAGQINRVLPLSATEFQNYRLVSREHPLAPMPLDRVILEPQAINSLGFVQHRRSLRLKKAGEGLVLREFSKFIVSHCSFL